MTARGVICEEIPRMCEMCGNIDECRPYGPNHEQICFTCAMEKCDPVLVEKRMKALIFGDTDD